MTLLRTLVFLLLLVNLVFAALLATGGYGGPRGQPELLTQQLHPEKITLIGQAPTEAAPEPAAPVTAEPEAGASPELAADETAAAGPAGAAPAQVPAPGEQLSPSPPGCVAFAGLNAEQADQLAEAASAFAVRRSVSGAVSYWVHIPPLADRAAAERKAGELSTLGVSDYFIVGEGAGINAISLGLYKTPQAAQRQLEALQARGVRSARVAERPGQGASVKLELRGAADTLAGFSSDWAGRLPGAQRSDCPLQP